MAVLQLDFPSCRCLVNGPFRFRGFWGAGQEWDGLDVGLRKFFGEKASGSGWDGMGWNGFVFVFKLLSRFVLVRI
jgi:hypothetical protein